MVDFEFPCPQRSIAALACSLLAHYGLQPPNPTLPEADNLLASRPRNVVLLLLDGLGEWLIRRHLSEKHFLIRHNIGTLSSVFPPTTAAAATALESGLFPAQSGWLGWSVYWPELDNNVNLYPNTTPDGRSAAPVHLGETYLSFQTLTGQIQGVEGVEAAALTGDRTRLDTLFQAVGSICRRPGRHFLYAYLDQPDHLLHKEGCQSRHAAQLLQTVDRLLETAFPTWPDTLLLVTADHGFLDLDGRCLEDFPALTATLRLPPSIEPRALNCFVKPGQDAAFLQALYQAVGDAYTVYPRAEVLRTALFGPGLEHPRFRTMVGDYLAVARTPLTLFPTRQYQASMCAGHGGMTSEELTVPLIAAWHL